MKNGNKILLGILTFIVVCVVGYALFSDTISVTGSATASGKFEITTTCTPGYSDELIAALGNPEGVTKDTEQGGFENSVCNVNGNEITATTDLLYPTAKRFFTVKMINTGSIPAVIWVPASDESFEIYSNNASWALKNKETNEIIKKGTDLHITHPSIHISNLTRFLDYKWTTIVVSNSGEINFDSNVIYDSFRDFVGIKLNPGDTVFSGINFRYPYHSNIVMSDNGKSEYFEFKLNYEFKWEQYIDSPNYESTSFDEWCFNGC